MNLKKILLALSTVALLAFAGPVPAQDNVGTGGGAVRNYPVTRWTLANIGESGNSATFSNTKTALTNLVTASPAIIGKTIIIPAAVSERLDIYNASAVTNINATNLIYSVTANSPTMANSPTTPLNLPQIDDLTPGYPASVGVVTISTRASSATQNKAYLLWDGVR